MLARLAGISPMVIGIGACGGVGVDGECSDGVQNGAETAVDCGGGCDPCGDGEGCASGLDCQNGICTNQMCAPAACIDNLKNGDESDIDCGGACGPTCQTTQDCNSGGDCQEGVCNGTCAAPTCTDGVRNSDETDMDCGGSCTGCAIGLTCEVPGDCGSGNCTPDAICGDAFRRVFITSQTTSGAMGGIAVGDALCQSLATSAGLTGTYLAWLSDNVVSPDTRYTKSTQPYVLVDGTPIASDYTDLVDGNLLVPINLTELGGAPPPTDPICAATTDFVHTGTNSTGTGNPSNCVNWTTAGAPGVWGRSTLTVSNWSGNCFGGNAAAALCGMQASLYCFEQ